MKIATLNIQAPGQDRRIRVNDRAVELDADVVVLTEYTSASSALQSSLRDGGYPYWADSAPTGRYRGVAIASKESMDPLDIADPCVPWAGTLGIRVAGVNVIGLYGPGSGSEVVDEPIKKLWWDGLLGLADVFRWTPTVLIGDLNNGKRGIDERYRTFACAAKFSELGEHGFFDAWRAVHGDRFDYSWKSNHGNEFRLDHVFASEHFHAMSSRYRHDLDPVSDHAALEADLEESFAVPIPSDMFTDAERSMAEVVVAMSRGQGTMFRGRRVECEVAELLGARHAPVGTWPWDLWMPGVGGIEVKSSVSSSFDIGKRERDASVKVWVLAHCDDRQATDFVVVSNHDVDAHRVGSGARRRTSLSRRDLAGRSTISPPDLAEEVRRVAAAA